MTLTPVDEGTAFDADKNGIFDSINNGQLTAGADGANNTSRGLLEFDLSSISGSVTSARLMLRPNSFGGSPSLDVEFHGYAGDGNVEPSDALVNNMITAIFIQDINIDLNIDVTSFIQTLPTYAGFMIRLTDETVNAYLGFSLTSPTAPSLIVNYSPITMVTIDISKQAEGPDTRTFTSGSDVPFEIVVTNTGPEDLSNVVVTDVLVPDCDRNIGDLAAGSSVGYPCTAPKVTETFTNEGCVNGERDSASVQDCDPSTVEIEPRVVSIDIKPGSDPNAINVRSQGKVPVAILTTEDFGADTVEASTVLFGPGKAKPVSYALEDVDGDTDWDLVLHFNTQETGITCVDTAATLTGQTIDDGIQLTGKDSIKTVGCKKK